MSRRLILPGRLRPMTDLIAGYIPCGLILACQFPIPLSLLPALYNPPYFRLNTQHCFSCLLPSGIVALLYARFASRELFKCNSSGEERNKSICMPDPVVGPFLTAHFRNNLIYYQLVSLVRPDAPFAILKCASVSANVRGRNALIRKNPCNRIAIRL